jgi:hypothetical protein
MYCQFSDKSRMVERNAYFVTNPDSQLSLMFSDKVIVKKHHFQHFIVARVRIPTHVQDREVIFYSTFNESMQIFFGGAW